MDRLIVLIVVMTPLMFGAASFAQETPAPEGAGAEQAGDAGDAGVADADAEDEEADEADEIDDSDLDLQTYEEDDDDFVPTEEVPADQAIPFPSDI